MRYIIMSTIPKLVVQLPLIITVDETENILKNNSKDLWFLPHLDETDPPMSI